MYICECGQDFNDDQEGAREHVLDNHLDVIETLQDDMYDSEDCDEMTDDEIFEEAVEDAIDELLDEILDGE